MNKDFPPSSREGWMRLLYEEERIVLEDKIVVVAALKRASRNRLHAAWQVLKGTEKPSFPLKGRDVLASMEAGPQVGELLGRVEAWWSANDFVPNKERCLTEARRLLQRP